MAASGKGKVLLELEFPQLKVLHLPGYNIAYASSAWGLAVKIVAQIPKLLSAIKKEHAWLQKVVEQESISAVISDNRYGLYHPAITSIFITHQLRIKAPFKMAESILQRLNYRYINHFDECWVPDAEGKDNLASELSHPQPKPTIPLHYLGPLSRFKQIHRQTAEQHLLIVLSGPEPQRTMFENTVLNDLEDYTSTVVLVRGLPGKTGTVALAKNVTVYNHLSAAELEDVMRKATFVIGRCGYSTVMDLAALQKKSILVPTPGQTEQEHLANHLLQKQFAFCIAQKKFRLKTALALAETFPYKLEPSKENHLRSVISALYAELIADRRTVI